jgi:hypothetical protein
MLKPLPQHRDSGFAIPPTRNEAPKVANPVDRLAQGEWCHRRGGRGKGWHRTGPAILRAPTQPCRACRARPDSASWHIGNGLFGPLKLLGDLNHLEETSSHPMIPVSYLGVEHL